MAEIPLRTYVQQLDNLIERKNVDEAIAHSRHILSFYPKHLDTYRMLGKALLEKGRHGDAADVFQRVLSVLPDDFISHVGMAIVREDEANVEAALWHMERAYEAVPSNGAIQQELCRLYGRRDGVVPPKARLTRGALGRMYTQGGLYLQAEAELRAALADHPERVDLQTILAQVYWFADQTETAAQLCGVILQSLPYSQVANRILREIFRARGRDADAALYRQRLEALDPYEALAAPAGDGDTLSTADQVEAEKVMVTRLEYVAGMESSGGPDWIASIGARFEDPFTHAGDGTPDWLNTPAEPADRAEVSGAADVPDWLAAASPANGAEPGAAAVGDLPAWLSEMNSPGGESGPSTESDADLPDWLKGGASNSPDDADLPAWMQAPTSAADEPPAAEVIPGDETLPPWLATGQDQPPPAEGPGAPADWMDTVISTPTGDGGAAPVMDAPQPAEDIDLPDWITSAAPVSAFGGDLPDWLKASTGTGPDTPATAEDAPVAAAPWLAGLDAEAAMPPAIDAAPGAQAQGLLPDATAAAPEDDFPAWMQTETQGEPEAPALPEPPSTVFGAEQPAAGLAPADDAPDWLAALPSATAAADDVPTWMQAAAEVTATAEPGTPAAEDMPAWMAEAPTTPTGEVPDWMQALAAEPAAESQPEAPASKAETPLAAATPAGELPDWLQALAADSVTEAEPAWLHTATPANELSPTTPGAEAMSEDLPDWLSAATAHSPGDEVPVWLQTPSAEALGSLDLPERPETADETEPAIATTSPIADESPSWLSNVQAVSSETVPAWLGTEPDVPAADEPEPFTMAAETPGAEITPLDDMPAWLQGTGAAAPDAGVPAWLQPGTVDLDAEAETDTSEAEQAPLAFDAEAQADAALMPGGAAEVEVTPAAEVPEWLRALSEDTEDNRTAHWEAMADTEFGTEEPGDLEEDEIEEPEQPLPEGIPDWLQAVAATAPAPDSQDAAELPQMEAEAPNPADTPVPAVELPDFLQLASPEAIARSQEPFELSEEPVADEAEEEPALAPGDMPDWLRALAPESPAAGTGMPAFDADIMAAAAAGMSLDDAPDWMKAVQSGTPAEAALPTGTAALNLGEVPAWLQPAEPAMAAESAGDLNLDDAPDWLREAASLTPAEASASEVAVPADAETPAWLQAATGSEQPADLPPWAQAEAPGPTDTVINFLAGKETPDWLEQLRAQASQPDAEALVDEPLEMSGAQPDAVPDLQASASAEGMPAPVMEAATAPPDDPAEAELSLDEMSPDEAMRWLEGLAAQQGAPAEELFMSVPTSTPDAPPIPAEAAAQAEAASETIEPEVSGGMPDWLREVEASFEVDVLADTAPHARVELPAAELPEWLAPEAQANAPADAELDVADSEPELEAPNVGRPEWLSELESLGDDLEPLPAEAEAESNLSAMSADEALRWLEEQAALAETKSVPVQGLAETEGLDDLGLHSSAIANAQAGVPDIESMNADEAMAWLEKLAAQQGASADELLSAPEDRPEDTPAWIVASQQADAAADSPEPGLVPDWLADLAAAADSDEEQPLEPGILPDWLTPPSDAVPEVTTPTEAPTLAAEPDAPETVISSGPDFASMDAEAAMAWLESLAAQQGANPEELLTAPEERPAEAPAWVQAEEAAAAQAEAEQAAVEVAPAAEPELAPVMEAAAPVEAIVPELAVAEQASAEPEPLEPSEPDPAAAVPQAPDVSKLSRLSERLAADRRAKEAEIEARFAQQRAEQEEARRLVWESMQAKKAAVEAAIEALEQPPASEPEPPAVMPTRARTGPLTMPVPRRSTQPLQPVPDDSVWVPATPPRKPAVVSRYAGQAAETVLAEAQAHLQLRDESSAAAALDHLVATGQMTDAVIVELEGAAGPTASVPLLRVLGDAYARSNRLQQALETYRQALRRL